MALVRIDPVHSEVRIYYDSGAAYDAPHDIALNIHHRPQEPGAVDITMHSAIHPHTRATLRALMQALLDAGIKTVYAHRGERHRLPGADQLPDGTWRLDLTRLACRVDHNLEGLK